MKVPLRPLVLSGVSRVIVLAGVAWLLFPSRPLPSPYEDERDLDVPEHHMPCALSFDPSGRHLLAVSGSPGALLIYDLDVPAPPRRLDQHDFRSGVLMRPDGSSFAAGGDDQIVRILKWDSGEVLQTISGFAHVGYSFAWSPDGRLLACANVEENVGIWDPENGKKLRTLTGHQESVQAIAFSPDGRRLVSASLDGTFRVWNSADGKEERVLRCPRSPGWALSAAFSPDGSLLATGGGYVTSSEDESTFHGFIRIFKCSDWSEIDRLDFGIPAKSLAFHPDGELLAFGVGNSIQLYNVRNRRHSGWHRAPAEASVWFSPDGKRIASAGIDYRVRLWKLKVR
jgi:WD40 repeat protein